MGVHSTPNHVYTTSLATANYIEKENSNARVYVIGEDGLKHAIESSGLTIVEEHADYVVIGIDRDITYEKLARGCLEIRRGARFISTNADIALPTERGLVPANGALTAVLTVSTGIEPTFIGKPESIIVEQALQVLGTKKEETVFVGDNYDTDILAGIQAGIDTLIVHTGVTTKERLHTVHKKPTYSLSSLAEWIFDE